MKTYPVFIEQEGDGYIVSCPIFEGCHSQGNTIDEALYNIKEAIELCLDDEENPVSNIILGNVVLERWVLNYQWSLNYYERFVGHVYKF